jgi:23S rRNA (pseudouridine1915-N3)-methyltransferase
MSIDVSTVDKIAFLSRLKIEDNVKEDTKVEFNKIIQWVDQLKEVNTDDINKNIELEGDLILNNIKKTDHVIALSIPGKNISSETFAQMIKDHYTYNSTVITFVIGGSNGLDQRVLDRSNYQLSFGKMTFPHQLMRMILLEQVYRCMMINNNHKYHK